MRKMLYMLTFVLPVAVLANINAIDAKSRGHMEEKNVAADAKEMSEGCTKKDCNCKNADCMKTNCNCMKKGMKKGMKSDSHWLAKQNEEITEDYDEALYKIEKSKLSAENKKILRTQAMQNRDLARKQAGEKVNLRMEQEKTRESFKEDIMKEKSNRKAVKEVNDIL